MTMTCGEATMRLLARYGVDTVFGIPGVHTLYLCRGLDLGDNSGGPRHIQARNEQGAGYMAEGWARATGQPGCALVISGPGVTNAATALGQCYADSLPFLLISAEPDSRTIGKGWGALHEITEQKQVTAPLTALSATARRAADVPDLMAQAFTIFASRRPRPCHISIPIDVQAELVEEDWSPIPPPPRPGPPKGAVEAAATRLRAAARPLIMIGGGAMEAGADIARVAEALGAPILSSNVAKGIVPDDHPLHLSAALIRPETQRHLAKADLILAVGTELAETDSFIDRLPLNGDLIRVDLDPGKLTDLYPATLGIVSDAAAAMAELAAHLKDHDASARRAEAEGELAEIRAEIGSALTPSEERHRRLLNLLRDAAPRETIFAGDACQLVYSGAFQMVLHAPRRWFYPAGFCTLGSALPSAIGAKCARPDTPVAALVGDGGFMFTMPELMTARDQSLPIPIIIWENGGLKQIQENMDEADIRRVGVEGRNPDFTALARACDCHAARPESGDGFQDAVRTAFAADRPTVIIVNEWSDWLA